MSTTTVLVLINFFLTLTLLLGIAWLVGLIYMVKNEVQRQHRLRTYLAVVHGMLETLSMQDLNLGDEARLKIYEAAGANSKMALESLDAGMFMGVPESSTSMDGSILSRALGGR